MGMNNNENINRKENKYCVLGSKVCPCCKKDIELKNDKCISCGSKIRIINDNLIKNDNYRQCIKKYDLNGEYIKTFIDVYEAFPIDTKEMQKKRQGVIDNCIGKTNIFLGFQWRLASKEKRITSLDYSGSKKAVVKVDFGGTIIRRYNSIKEASYENGVSEHVIRNTISGKKPFRNKEFYLLAEKDFCYKEFEVIHDEYLDSQYKVEVVTPKGEKELYETYAKCAKKYGKSPTTVREWCNGVAKPHNELENYIFRNRRGFIKKIIGSCNKSIANSCEINKENEELKEQIEYLKKQLNILSNQNKEKDRTITALKKQIKKLGNRKITIFENIDSRIPYKISINDFQELINKKKYITGPHIYILTDENGKRYVGQSNRNNYSRIVEHFHKQSKDAVNKEFCNGTNFYVEKIIVGWNTTVSFNLNVAESFFIGLYDSCDNGYNCTRGNHSELSEYEYILNNFFDNTLTNPTKS